MVKSHCVIIWGGAYIITNYCLVFIFLEGGFILNILVTNGISKTAVREENDYYATHPKAMHDLLKYETFSNVFSTDLIDRGYPDDIVDFLTTDIKFKGDIITNPPFKYTTEFILKALDCIEMGGKVAMFLKINYLSGKKRYEQIYSKVPPYRVYVFSGKIACSKNNKPEGFKAGAMDYVWMIWEKGRLGPTELKWINS